MLSSACTVPGPLLLLTLPHQPGDTASTALTPVGTPYTTPHPTQQDKLGESRKGMGMFEITAFVFPSDHGVRQSPASSQKTAKHLPADGRCESILCFALSVKLSWFQHTFPHPCILPNPFPIPLQRQQLCAAQLPNSTKPHCNLVLLGKAELNSTWLLALALP